MLTRHTPDLAVMDVMMPFADGLSVCREARHRASSSSTANGFTR
ncbi:MAG: hypothetical protein ACKORY_08860 [Actinomycetota bacterium]